jgi:hypothetical protein
MIQIENAVASLNRIFHSEDDFQHALAWELQSLLEQHSEWDVRLEYLAENGVYVDICLVAGDSIIPIELKYRTTEARFENGSETFRLREHSARDIGRYEFIHDIERVERITSEMTVPGFAIFLTNDAGYWHPSSSNQTANGDDFRIHEDRILEDTLDWREYKSYMPDKRCRPITLRDSYQLQWKQYSHPVTSSGDDDGEFRYLIVSVD